MKIKNIYRSGLKEEYFADARINSNWACLKVLGEMDVNESKTGQVLLSAGAAEQSTGILFFQLINCGDDFKRKWNASTGELFLLSHLAGDRLQKFIFVESEDVLLKWGLNVFETPTENLDLNDVLQHVNNFKE